MVLRDRVDRREDGAQMRAHRGFGAFRVGHQHRDNKAGDAACMRNDLGGVGQLAGSVMAAFGLGIANKILEPQIGAVLGKILILALIILFIQKRPQGLFALKGRVID